MRQDMAVELCRMRISLCCMSTWESSASASLVSVLCKAGRENRQVGQQAG